MIIIKEFDFGNKDETIKEINDFIHSNKFNLKSKNSRDYLNNWPVVYIIRNEDKKNKIAYIGETTSISNRICQHLKNPERLKMNKIDIVFDDKNNKSSILDTESFLIQYMSSIYNLQNGNDGLKNHDYDGKEYFTEERQIIWNNLIANNIIDKDCTINNIENDNIFKYSPYKELNDEQREIINKIMNILVNEEKSTIMLEGVSGTGKTVVGIYIIKLIKHLQENNIYLNEINEEFEIGNLIKDEELKKILNKKYNKIGYVVPLGNLRSSIISIFRRDMNLDENMVISPINLNVKLEEKYDLIIVDEMHRLKRPGFALDATTLNAIQKSFNPSASQIEWIMENSKSQIFMYDKNQRVRGSDITTERITELENRSDYQFELTKQMRCRGGNEYITFIKDLITNKNPVPAFYDYDFQVFDNPHDMIKKIIELDNQYDLCRTVSGIYKDDSNDGKILENDKIENVEFIPKNNNGKIIIDHKNYLWNIGDDWIHNKNSKYQIGCIHTIQGCDLNYAGVILGNDIKYNPNTKKIEVSVDNNSDMKSKIGKNNLNYNKKEMEDNILDVYYTLLTRGIRGTYVYAYDSNLQDYLKKVTQK